MTRRNSLHAILFLMLPILFAAAQPAQAQATVLQGVASVVDGDSLEIRGQPIRLFGIDGEVRPENAPVERFQYRTKSGQACEDADGQLYRCGQHAALALSDRIGRNPVTCEHLDTDRYGRMVAVCTQGSLDLNGWMVREGHALAYRRYSKDYVGEEAQARRDRRGVWAGGFIAPWAWRQGERLPSERNAAGNSAAQKPGCTIKGNVSGSGERIYHVPGQQHYDRTRISPGKGERSPLGRFLRKPLPGGGICSEAEARAAGWRKARR